MSKIIGLKELRENMNIYITQVEKGRSFTVVRKSKPVFKMMPVDEWGDEGTWKKVVDFTEINKKGVRIEKILARLEALDEQDRQIPKKALK